VKADEAPLIPVEKMLDLIDALNELRDALVSASLALSDHQFDKDPERRRAAIANSNEFLERLKNG